MNMKTFLLRSALLILVLTLSLIETVIKTVIYFFQGGIARVVPYIKGFVTSFVPSVTRVVMSGQFKAFYNQYVNTRIR